MEYIKNYSVVDDKDGYYRLCKNEDIERVKREFADKYNEDAENFRARTLDNFILKSGIFEFETTVRGSIFDSTVSIDFWDVVAVLVDELHEKVSENDLNRLCDNGENMFDVVWGWVNEKKKELLVLELESMISNANMGWFED